VASLQKNQKKGETIFSGFLGFQLPRKLGIDNDCLSQKADNNTRDLEV